MKAIADTSAFYALVNVFMSFNICCRLQRTYLWKTLITWKILQLMYKTKLAGSKKSLRWALKSKRRLWGELQMQQRVGDRLLNCGPFPRECWLVIVRYVFVRQTGNGKSIGSDKSRRCHERASAKSLPSESSRCVRALPEWQFKTGKRLTKSA